MSVKEHAKNVDTWVRGLFILIFGIIFYFLYGIIWLLVVFQFITKVVTGDLNVQLEKFSGSLTQFAMEILHYITYQSEYRPFPFNPWPAAPSSSSKKKASKKGADSEDTPAE